MPIPVSLRFPLNYRVGAVAKLDACSDNGKTRRLRPICNTYDQVWPLSPLIMPWIWKASFSRYNVKVFTTSHVSVRKVISRSKFMEQFFFASCRTKVLNTYRYKTCPPMRMRNQMMNIHLPTYNTVLKVLQSSWIHVDRRSSLPAAPVQVVCTGTDLQLTRDGLDYDSHHAFASRYARAMPGLGNWELKANILSYSTAEMYTIQAVSFITIRLRSSVHRK